MSIFNELLPKILEISKISSKNFDDDLKDAFQQLENFEEEYQNGRNNSRDKAQRDKTLMTTLQSINEDDDEIKTQNTDKTHKNDKTSSTENKKRDSKKRSKDEVEDMSSPEPDKRLKRNASVKAQSIISKQDREILMELDQNGIAFVSSIKPVNVNLTQKMRREDSTDKSKSRRRKDDDKENALPVPPVQIKQEKISLPPEPMEEESLPVNVNVKQEVHKDDIAMPPPVAPVPKPRKGVAKEKSEESSEDETGSKRRGTRTKKVTDTVPPPPEPKKGVAKEKSEESSEDETDSKRRGTRTKNVTDTMPPPPVPSARSTRASSRASSRNTRTVESDATDAPTESRPKRTRAKKKLSEAAVETEKDSAPQENGIGSPAEKPRPKRTRRGKEKAPEIEPEIPKATQISHKEPETLLPKEERLPAPEPSSPVLQKDLKATKKSKKLPVPIKKTTKNKGQPQSSVETEESDADNIVLDETRVLETINATVTISNDMDKTMVLPNGVYNHAPVTPNNFCNATVVLEKCDRQTMVLDKPSDATVIIEKENKARNLTDDNSLLTDDNSDHERTPPKPVPQQQPSSAVKEKVQQFEELAARTTRTKTRAMAKMDDPDNHTPPDKIAKPVFSAETLSKMNNMIFNGKPPQISSSATKPRVPSAKPQLPSTTGKLASIQRHKEAADEMKNDKEDARRKKEAMLEAKRELQKKKREEKMAAAAAAREAAERGRRLALQAAARERDEKQAHADLGKVERLREVERKKQELARKVAETEERRRAEEKARQQRLAEEQKKADAARCKQLEEAEAMKREAILAKEIEKRQKEYMEKLKVKYRLENEKMEPVYMQDGFQHLNSDEEQESVARPVPTWSTSKMRKLVLGHQACVTRQLVEQLFSVRVHSPDLRVIFPTIERARLKRTSSAVWRTPPPPPPPTE